MPSHYGKFSHVLLQTIFLLISLDLLRNLPLPKIMWMFVGKCLSDNKWTISSP